MSSIARQIGEKRGEPTWVLDLREEAEAYIKKTDFPEGIASLSLDKYNPLGKGDVSLPDIKTLDDIPADIRNMLVKMGVPQYEWQKILGLLQVDTSTQMSSFKNYFEEQGVVVMPMSDALKKYDWLRDYAFKLMPYKKNKIAAYHTAYWNGGVFMWIKKGARVTYPLHTYFLITEEALAQADHALIVAEEDSEVTFIEGCTAPPLVRFSSHIGATEVYVKSGAKVKGVVLQNWPNYVNTRPYTHVFVEEKGGIDIVVAILGTGKSAGRFEEVDLKGPYARASVNSLSFVKKDEMLDDVIKINLEGPYTKGLIRTKSLIRDNGISTSTTSIEAKKGGCFSHGHIECTGLLLTEGGKHSTYPSVSSKSPSAFLNHEAYVGKISEEVVSYLMSRGLNEEDSLSLIVKGYVEPVTKYIPFEYVGEILRMANLIATGGL